MNIEVIPEPCAGCGVMSCFHPMVGIARSRPGGPFEAYPVCEACWRDPVNRKHKLKMHFFPIGMKNVGLKNAGSSDLGGR